MPSVSKKQQNFFRLVKAVKAGKVKKKDVDDSVRKAAKSMTKKEISDFADHLDENILYNKWEDYSVYDLLEEFLSDKDNGIETVQFNLIPAAQYTNLLRRFMSVPNPQMARIPESIVNEWLDDIATNTLKIQYITDLAGHSSSFPTEDCEDVFGEDTADWSDYESASEYLDNIGFYDWCKLPDGSDAWSDFGLEPIWKIFKECEDDSEGYEKLMIINRVLDVGHCRGDLASAFIEGGSKTCSEISNMEEGFKSKSDGYVMCFEEFNNSKFIKWKTKFDKYLNEMISELQEDFLNVLGIRLKINENYRFTGWKSRWLAAYERKSRKILKGVLSVGVNYNLLYSRMCEMGTYTDNFNIEAQARITIGHEVGHGLCDYMKNCVVKNDTPNISSVKKCGERKEEEIVEEFGEYMFPDATDVYDSVLFKAFMELTGKDNDTKKTDIL